MQICDGKRVKPSLYEQPLSSRKLAWPRWPCDRQFAWLKGFNYLQVFQYSRLLTVVKLWVGALNLAQVALLLVYPDAITRKEDIDLLQRSSGSLRV